MLKLYKRLSLQKPNTKLGVTSDTVETAKPDNELLDRTYEETDQSTDTQQMCHKHYPPSTRE